MNKNKLTSHDDSEKIQYKGIKHKGTYINFNIYRFRLMHLLLQFKDKTIVLINNIVIIARYKL